MEFWKRKKEKSKTRKLFLENGRKFLEKLIEDCNGISNPIRMFSSHQISEATYHFHPNCSLSRYDFFTWHTGVIEDRPSIFKTYPGTEFKRERIQDIYNDIVLSSRVSNHNGFVKLVGCCLEFPFPVMVFEDPKYGSLNHRGSIGPDDGPLLPWDIRLKIAKEVAIAVTYLHTAFPRIIIHREIKPSNVFLDKNLKAKLTDFSISVTLPEGKSWIEDRVFGTLGFVDPLYIETGIVSEYVDVFSFGIFMLVLLLGRRVFQISEDHIISESSLLDYVKDLQERGEIVEYGGDSSDMKTGQMKLFLELALMCCRDENEDRPKMIWVAKMIKLIETSLDW